jgi:hypothetical protein
MARMTAQANATYQTQATKGNDLLNKFSSIGSKVCPLVLSLLLHFFQ